jgi:hypothetical protein
VAFTDGMPSDPEKACAAAEPLKQSARLVTVGIEKDVHKPLLRSMATGEEDSFDVTDAESILLGFVNVIELLWNDGREAFEGLESANMVSVTE